MLQRSDEQRLELPAGAAMLLTTLVGLQAANTGYDVAPG